MRSRVLAVVVVIGSASVFMGCEPRIIPPMTPLVVANTGSGAWVQDNSHSVQFVVERSFGDDEANPDALVGWPAIVTADGDHNVYIFDGRAGRIVSFDSSAAFRWSTGSMGQGPGQFENPFSLAVRGNYLFVSNGSGSRLDRFALVDGSFVDSRPMRDLGRERATVIGFSADDEPILTGQLGTRPGAFIDVVDPQADSARVRIVADIPELADAPTTTLAQNLAWSGGLITTGYYGAYRHTYYDTGGVIRRTVTRDLPIPPPVITPQYIQNYSAVNAPVRVADNYWLATASWPSNVDDVVAYDKMDRATRPRLEFATTVDLFDDAGHLLWSKVYSGGEQAPFGRVLHADGDKIYVVSGGVVKRMRVEVGS